jgi:predicted ATPase/transcriptional regulator with XRE-family HTH domain
MEEPISFGYWVRRRRKALDLTQGDLARQVGCAEVTIQKIEADERRPSKHFAERMAEQLGIPLDERTAFLRCARGEAPIDTLAAPPVAERRVAETPAPEPSANTRPHNLPTQLTSFIGCTHELAQTRDLLAGARLLTLTGPGGTGKTRLALQLANALVADFTDGVWLVELAALSEPALVSQAVATALGVREEPEHPLLATLAHHLRDQQMLLLLDNCEHLIEASAHLAERLLNLCPNLRVLASSREPLGISGEAIFRVPPLSVPDSGQLPPLDELARFESIVLFVERARAGQPEFQLTDETRADVAQVCQRLDGIPLAIELAAARVRILTVEQIGARLDDRFRLLTGGSRTALPRHQTLRALIDWSYDLLTEEERRLLGQLTVFVGGWSLEAAETLWAGEVADVLDLLTRLVDKSLVQVEQQHGAARYRLLETIRQYGLEKLAASGEADALRRRHADYYLSLAESGWADHAGRLSWFVLEYDNFRAALRWAVEQPAGETALRLVHALEWFWYRGGYWSEGRTWLRRTLERPEIAARTHARAAILGMLGHLSWNQSDSLAGQALLHESLALYRELGDPLGSTYPLIQLAVIAREQGDAAQATALLEEMLAIGHVHAQAETIAWAQVTMGEVAVLREDAAEAAAWLTQGLASFQRENVGVGIAWALNHLGHVAQLRGEYEQAAALHAESLILFRETDQQGVGWALESQGQVALARGELDDAYLRFAESLQLALDLGYKPGIAWCLAGLAATAALDAQPVRAAQLWGAAEALRSAIGIRPPPASRVLYDRAITTARGQLGDAAFEAAWAAGQAIPLEDAIAAAMAPSRPGQR